MPLNRSLLVFIMPLIVAVFFFDSSLAFAEFEPEILLEQEPLPSENFTKWTWMQNTCDRCEIAIHPTNEELKTPQVLQFIEALSQHKSELQDIYKIDGPEYTLLAQMSVGILGRESDFFTSPRYRLKEALPWAVHLAKIIHIFLSGKNSKVSANSRGPTQIKIVPDKVARHFGIHSENLSVPENAAIATMGFLIEALEELKRHIQNHHLEFITEPLYADYLPYIYFGRTKALLNHTAKPEQNSYVREMKKYMSWVEIYELQPLLKLQ